MTAYITYRTPSGQIVSGVADTPANREMVSGSGSTIVGGEGAHATDGGTATGLTVGGTSTATGLDGALTGPQRDAAAAVTNLFTTYGLGSLAPKIMEYIKNGYSADTASLMLQDTSEYKTRFAGNTARLAKGLSVLSPAEYLATEKSYGQIMSKYGLPAGFHDQTSDYQKFIENDMSPVELDQRAQQASDFVNRNDAQSLAYFKQYYSQGDMIAYALDPKRAAPLVGKAYEASLIGGAAASQGIQVGQLTSEDLAGRGVTADQAQQGFGIVGQDQQQAQNLSSIYGGQPLTTQDLIDATFKNDAAATMRKNKLASQERANFGGSGGAGATALSASGAIG